MKKLKENNSIDYINLDKKNKLLKISKLPNGFENKNNKVIKSEISVTDDIFVDLLTQTMEENGYSSKISMEQHTAFPDNEGDFMNLFYDESKNQMKNPKLFQSRILGLVSFYKTQNKNLLPTVIEKRSNSCSNE